MDDSRILRAVQYFRSTYDFNVLEGIYSNYNEDVFYEVMGKFASSYNIVFSDEDIALIKRKVDAEFQIYQLDSEVLISDYEHDKEWYTDRKQEIVPYYWNRYRHYLFEKGWSTDVLSQLEYGTLDKIMNQLGDPQSSDGYNRRGLVMGDVQSGKTSNYIGLIAKAADAGYKVIILLSGTIEDLRKQTQIRVEEGFIGYDTYNRKWVGVGKEGDEDKPLPHSVTSRENDFTGISGDTTGLRISNYSKAPHIFITKKNATTLKKIKDTLRDLNIIPPQKKINSSLLVIDDEADNASVNTNSKDLDPTRINSEIRELLSLFSKSNYVGFTATPFANVFIDPNSETEMLDSDLFPRDFIFVLKPPSNYHGAEKIFLDENNNTVQLIDDSNDLFPLVHKQDWDGYDLFPSFTEALNVFLLSNAIRDLREKSIRNSHRSMLINVSRFIKVQDKIYEIVKKKIQNILNAIRFSHRLAFDDYIQNRYINDLFNAYNKNYSKEYDWNTVFSVLYQAVQNIEIYQVPSRDKKRKIDYEKHKDTGLRCIVIGGLALSRGLTLEGLTVSYLYRNTSTFDVLMQMARWFGYRNNPLEYGDLCKVWMLPITKKYFIEITNSIKELKKDFSELVKSGKTPQEFGIRVRNESESLGITSINKMRNTKKYIYTYDLYGQVLETPFINSNIDDIYSNYNQFKEFTSKLEFVHDAKSLVAKDIHKEHVTEFLSKINIHDANTINYFEKDKIIDFLRDELKNDKFDVVIVGGDSKTSIEIGSHQFTPIMRKFDFIDNESILRINAKHRRLGGKSDTRFGLSIEERKKIDDKSSSSSSYMIEGRNPLLLIYPIQLKKILENDEDFDQFNPSEIDLINEYIDKLNQTKTYPIGIGVAFPRNKKQIELKKQVYIINTKTNWYELMRRKDNEADE